MTRSQNQDICPFCDSRHPCWHDKLVPAEAHIRAQRPGAVYRGEFTGPYADLYSADLLRVGSWPRKDLPLTVMR